MTNPKNPSSSPEYDISAAIRYACKRKFGVLDSNFLCQSLSILDLHAPICINETDSLQSAISIFQDKKIGCVMVMNSSGKMSGIFSERDCIYKLLGKEIDLNNTPISQFMTREPVTQPADSTMAYALNLMSQGGFRHLPIVDESGMPVGIVSTKDVVDYIVSALTEDLLKFETDLQLEGDSSRE